MTNSTPTKLTFPELLHWINLIAKLPWDAQAILKPSIMPSRKFKTTTHSDLKRLFRTVDPFLCHDGIDVIVSVRP